MPDRLNHLGQPLFPFDSRLEQRAAEIRGQMSLMLRLTRESLRLAETIPSRREAELDDALLMLAHKIRLTRDVLPEIERWIAEQKDHDMTRKSTE